MLFVSLGCPCGVGPEIAVRAALRRRCVLVGDAATLVAAAAVAGVDPELLTPWHGGRPSPRQIPYVQVGPRLSAKDRRPGRPGKAAGRAQLAWIDAAYGLAVEHRGAIVTGPVSKEIVARSGVEGAETFLGHTEWLESRDGAAHSVMCFAAPSLVTSLVTTHVPVQELPGEVTADRVTLAIVELATLLQSLGVDAPRIAVTSLNPHAGEGELLGVEERTAIVPGIRAARRRVPAAEIVGPIGAETAYRKARGRAFHGVAAMFHDQATIPLKLIAFGRAVNVTMGLSVVRTSVDHGTGYDIAGQGVASAKGLDAALVLAGRLLRRKGGR